MLHAPTHLILELKAGVWCAISERIIIGPAFFHETINSERYVRLILSLFFDQLMKKNRTSILCENNATASANESQDENCGLRDHPIQILVTYL
jgi:hypothetical protein